jgi:hypothetical protein
MPNTSVNPNYWEGIGGWFDFDDIYSHMVQIHPNGAHFVEVGAWLGRSACYMATQIALAEKDIKFDAVDLWQIDGNSPDHIYDQTIQDCGGDMLPVFMMHMHQAGVATVVRPIKMLSLEAARLYPDASLDLVFIDANHFYSDVCADIKAWLPKVKTGGYLGGHDYVFGDGVRKAVDELLQKDYVIMSIRSSWLVQKV